MSIVYKCKKCIKEYSTYKSLWRHNALKHKDDVVSVDVSNVEKNVSNVPLNVSNSFNCSKCNENFNSRTTKWRHEKKCENIIEIKVIEEKTKDEKIDLVMKENLEMKKEMEKLKEMLQKALKIHPKTLTKINKQLNNTINNNNIYVQLGNENLSEILSNKQKMGILNRQVMGINDLVELIHVSGKFKKFMNVYITNLQNSIAYRYDEKQKNFIAVNKSELLNDLIDSRMYDIEKFYDEVENILDANKAKNIKRFIERMKDTDDYLKGLKKDEIKLILYNNRDKILPKEDLIEIKEFEI